MRITGFRVAVVGIAAVLFNNYVYYSDLLYEKHDGAILLGYFSHFAVILSVGWLILSFLVLGGIVHIPGFQLNFTPAGEEHALARAKDKHLRRLNHHLKSLGAQLEEFSSQSEEISEFVESAKQEIEGVGRLSQQLSTTAPRKRAPAKRKK